MKKRYILLGEVSENKYNFFSLMAGITGQYALSDQQMKEVDDRLLVRSVDEYISKFGDNVLIEHEEHKTIDSNLDTYKQELLNMSEKYEVFYSYKNQNVDTNYRSIGNLFYFEVLEGLKLIFRHITDEAEILVFNIGLEDELTESDTALLRLFLDTTNTKTDKTYRIDGFIVPGLAFPQYGHKSSKTIFRGTQETTLRKYVNYSQVVRIAALAENYNIPVLVQYECVEEAGPSGFAVWGEKYFRAGSEQLLGSGYEKNIVICYPNLSSHVENIYIGAAFAVVSLLEVRQENSDIPRELYPYTDIATEDAQRADFGAMLIYKGNKMALACYKGLKGNQLDV